MLHRIAGEAQADHLIDLLLFVRELDVGAPRRQIRTPLPAESILRRDDQAGLVALFAQRAHQLARHHQMPAFGERRARRDDRNRWPLLRRSVGRNQPHHHAEEAAVVRAVLEHRHEAGRRRDGDASRRSWSGSADRYLYGMPCGIASSTVCCELGAMSMMRRSPPVEITTRFGLRAGFENRGQLLDAQRARHLDAGGVGFGLNARAQQDVGARLRP